MVRSDLCVGAGLVPARGAGDHQGRPYDVRSDRRVEAAPTLWLPVVVQGGPNLDQEKMP